MADVTDVLTEAAHVISEKSRKSSNGDLDFSDITPKTSSAGDLSFEELIPKRRASLLDQIGSAPTLLGFPLREAPRLASDVASAYTLGLFPPKSFSQSLPPIESKVGQLADILGQGAALVAGPAGAGGRLVERGLVRAIPNVMSTILGRLGVRAAEGATIGALSDVTDPQAISRRAGIGAGLNALLPPLFQRAQRDVRAVGLLNRIGPMGSMRSARARSGFLEPLRKEAVGAPSLSGPKIPQRVQELTAQFPERQQQLGAAMIPAVESIQEQFARNPLLVKSALKSAEDSGRLELLKRVFPETEIGFERLEQMGPGTTGDVVTSGRIAFRRQLIQEMRNQGLLPAELRPHEMSFEQIQQLKRVFGDIIEQTSRKPISRITQTDVDAATAFGAIREAELSAHPELKAEFETHRGVMNSIRSLGSSLSKSGKFEELLKGLEGATADEQLSMERLLSPSSLLKAQTFADATQFQRGVGTIARRAFFYTTIFPVYALFSLVRSEIFREARRR